MSAPRVLSEQACFGGVQGFYAHASSECAAEMRFGVYRPPQADRGPVPVLYYLAGLTCTQETAAIKAGAQRVAAELGLMLVTPDTSPRVRLPGDDLDWDFGLAAGFYLDATAEPWSAHYRMHSYVTRELPALIAGHFPGDTTRQGITGHSMGGHGALVCALRNPGLYRSVSAFAPISAPTQCPWGQKAFGGYLGPDRAAWTDWDATELVARQRHPATILVEQGLADGFLEQQLKTELFLEACRRAGQAVDYRPRAGYDHGYYFVSTFIEDHLRHHAQALAR